MNYEEHYSLSTLAQHPEYYKEVIKLIETEFQYNQAHSYANDFSPLMNPLNHENCYFVIDKSNNKVVSHIAICQRELIKNNVRIPVGFVGGIATDKEYRNRGLFKYLFNAVLSEHEKKLGLFILWSDLAGLYEKFSFYLAGGTVESGTAVLTDQDIPAGFFKTKMNLLTDSEFNQIQSIYHNNNEKMFFTVSRDEASWSLIRQMDTIDLFVKKDSDGKIIQYFCANKGFDLTNIIHEIGTKDGKIDPLVNQLKKYRLWLPEIQKKVITPSNTFYTAFFKIGDIALLGQFLSAITNNQLKILKYENDVVQLEFKNNTYQFTSQEFLNYLIGPNPLIEFEEFKLSPYISGFDSI